MKTLTDSDIVQRITQLRQEHFALDQELAQKLTYTDQLHITRLKKRKLCLKDQITQLEDLLTPDEPA